MANTKSDIIYTRPYDIIKLQYPFVCACVCVCLYFGNHSSPKQVDTPQPRGDVRGLQIKKKVREMSWTAQKINNKKLTPHHRGLKVLGVKISKVREISWTAEEIDNCFNPRWCFRGQHFKVAWRIVLKSILGMQLSCTITQLIFWAKPGNPRMESGRGGWEAGREKERGRQGGRGPSEAW